MTADRHRHFVPICLVVALAAGLASTLHYRWLRAERAAVEALLDGTGITRRHPELATRVLREPDPIWGRLLIVRALLADELDRSWTARLSRAEREEALAESPQRLRMVRQEANRIASARPANWQAAMTRGAAAYVEQTRGLAAVDRRAWEQPLFHAFRLGPQRLEPARLLAAALIGNWSSVGTERREESLTVLRAAFRDEESLALLIEPWLRVASGQQEAFAVLHDVPETWARLEQLFERQGDWERYAAARRRWYPAERRYLEWRLADGERRLRTGDVHGARDVLLRVAAATPVEDSFCPLFSRAVEAAPRGWSEHRQLQRIRPWLSWGLELYLWGESPLAGTVLATLAEELAAAPLAGALAELAAGNLDRAEALEKRAEGDPTTDWSRYRIRKAVALAESGRRPEAELELGRVPNAARDTLLYRWALTLVEPHAAADVAHGLRRRFWAAGEWGRGEREGILHLLPAARARGLAVEIAGVDPAGAVVEVHLQGRRLLIEPLNARRRLEVEADVPARPQRLRLITVAGRPVVPGSVELLD